MELSQLESYQRLSPTPMLLRNDEDNEERERGTGDGVYRVFILEIPQVFLFVFIPLVYLAVHTSQ
jgi:hypothetical protein